MKDALRELARPTKAKFLLALLLAVASYALLMATKEAYEVPVMQLSADGNSTFSIFMGTAVQLNPAVLVALFPLSSSMMAIAFGGIPSNFTCNEAGPCGLATGTSYLYLIALELNLPYYYLLAGLMTVAYEKKWKKEEPQ